MSANTQVSFDDDGSVRIDLPRAFKVRLFADTSVGPVEGNTTDEIVWAHACTPTDGGALVFTYYKKKNRSYLRRRDEDGEGYRSRAADVQPYLRTGNVV